MPWYDKHVKRLEPQFNKIKAFTPFKGKDYNREYRITKPRSYFNAQLASWRAKNKDRVAMHNRTQKERRAIKALTELATQ